MASVGVGSSSNEIRILEIPRKFHEILPHTETLFDLDFIALFHIATRSAKEISSWDEGLQDLVLAETTLYGYLVDVSNAHCRRQVRTSYDPKLIWKLFDQTDMEVA